MRWFDAAAPVRPAWLAAVPSVLLAVSALGLGVLWLRLRWGLLAGPTPPGPSRELLLAVGLAVLFRLPMVVEGAASYVTADGALSGIVAVHLREGIDHPVFVPHVPYSGSLKSHAAAALSLVMDTARAFALVSVLFYALFVAAVYRLALVLGESAYWTAPAAALYAVFPPAFVTRYSLSNDGNYVEVLALGTWALVLAARWARDGHVTSPAATAAGLLLGLAFWCHILAAIHVAAVGLCLLLVDARIALRRLAPLTGGFVLGYLPGLLWNAGHGWESLRYVVPGGEGLTVEEGLAGRAYRMIVTQWPVLLGYDPGYPSTLDVPMRTLAWLAVGLAAVATVGGARAALRHAPALRVLLVFTASNVVVALLALPVIDGNPRYLLFLMAPLPILLARILEGRGRRWVMVALAAFGAATSVGQVPGAARSDARWRAFVAALEREGIRWCYTDFYLAAKIDFLAEERVTCSAKLGPTTTEYFFEYRERVERAPEAALIAVNESHAEKLERRLARLGISYVRRDLMKPVLLRLSRKVDPEELFPEREFPLR